MLAPQPQALQQFSPQPAQAATAPVQQGSPSMAPNPSMINSPASGEDDGMTPGQGGDTGQQQMNSQTQEMQQRLDSLPDHDKQFLAQYLTPEFAYAIGLVSGQDAGQYLSQFVDPNKVLVPLSKQQAQQIQAAAKQQQGQQGQPPAQGQAPAPQQPTPQAKPPVQAPQPSQQLPNGVTPAPMQHGIMAPGA